MASGHHCASISMIVFLLFGALLVCAQEMQADVVETPYEALLLDDDASVLKTLRLSASERSANATFVVPDEEFSFSALAPVNCLRGFKVDSKSSTLLSFSDIECKLEMLWMKENFYLTRDGIDADEGVSHLKSAVQVVIKKKIASYGAITVEGACDLKLTPNSNPNIEGKFVVNLSISRGQSTGPTCDIELDFGAKYKYYKPPVSTESFGATKSSAGNTLLIIILSVVGAIVLLALLGIAMRKSALLFQHSAAAISQGSPDDQSYIVHDRSVVDFQDFSP
uniref:Uncharacterized protein n=1 Tax=Ditylenchus dipsaci TaxID=166011 RepID=A0A915E9X3_9BILA